MKFRLLTLLFIHNSFLVFSQNGINKTFEALKDSKNNAKRVMPFTLKSNTALNNLFNDGFAPISLNLSQQILQEITPATNLLNLSLPLGVDQSIELELYSVNIFSPDFKVLDENKNEIAYDKGLFFHGRIKGDTTSIAAISILDGEISGIISDSTGNRTLKKQPNSSNYLLYYEHNMKTKPSFICTNDDSTPLENPQYGPINNAIVGCKIVNVSVEVDYLLYQLAGSNINNAANYVVALFNQVALLYRNDLMAVQLSSIGVWTSQDPYYGSSTDWVLYYFKTLVGTNFNGNLAHLFSGKNMGGQANGFTGLCNKTYGHSVSGGLDDFYNVPTYSWSVYVVAHEMGHNFGSRHTHACVWNGNNTAIDGCGPTYAGVGYEGSCSGAPIPSKGTIMSYCHWAPGGIGFSNGFGPQPGNYIRNNVSNCASIATNYAVPINPATSNISYTTATVSWTIPLTSTSFTIRYRPVGAANWQTTTSTGSSKNLSGLNSGVQYEWQVTGDCSSAYTSSLVFTTLSNATITTGSISATLCRNTNLNVNFTITGTFNSGNVFTAQLSNSSGSFSSPVNIGTLSSTTAGAINSTIPSGTPVGTGYRIRVISSSPEKTGTDNGSNIEINAIPAAPTANSVSRCGPGTVALSASGCSGGTMKWYANATTTTVLNTGASYTTPSISTNTNYYVNCTVGNCVSSRTTVTATILTLPAAPTANSVSRCGPGTVALSASGCSGGTMKWYANATTTTVLNTGVSYTTPSISTNTNYYVDCTVGNCVSNRTTVTATILTLPAAPTANSASRCGPGTVALSSSGCSGGTMKWYANATTTTVLNTGVSYTTPSISTNTNYYVDCTVGNCVSNRTTVTATILTLPAAPTANSASRCGPGTVALSASSCSGGTMKWYANATTITVLNTGVSYTTPSISTNTSYYVDCTVGNCVSNRTTVTAVVNVNISFTNPSQASGTYRASQTIMSISNVATQTYYYAGKSILLTPGFQAGSGEIFTASIQDCP